MTASIFKLCLGLAGLAGLLATPADAMIVQLPAVVDGSLCRHRATAAETAPAQPAACASAIGQGHC